MTNVTDTLTEALEQIERLAREGDPKGRSLATQNLSRVHTIARAALESIDV